MKSDSSMTYWNMDVDTLEAELGTLLLKDSFAARLPTLEESRAAVRRWYDSSKEQLQAILCSSNAVRQIALVQEGDPIIALGVIMHLLIKHQVFGDAPLEESSKEYAILATLLVRGAVHSLCSDVWKDEKR